LSEIGPIGPIVNDKTSVEQYESNNLHEKIVIRKITASVSLSKQKFYVDNHRLNAKQNKIMKLFIA
jgi:hypothetical protein